MAAHIRLARWAERHPHRSNAVLMSLGIALTFILFGAVNGDGVTPWCTAVCAVPLYFRKAAPVATAYAVGGLALAALLIFNVAAIDLCLWAVPCVLHTVASRASGPARRGVYTTALVGCVVLGLTSRRWLLEPSGPPAPGQWAIVGITSAVLAAAFATVGFLTGDLARERRRRREELEERARRLEVERDQEVRLAAQDERARIAREMHDVVAHSLSVVIAQADGARYAAASEPGVAVDTLGTIAETARGSLSEMRRLLGVLRTEEETSTAPVPQLAQVEDLVASVRRAGVPVDFRVAGEPHLSQGAQLTLYRVVQEALTNVLKHAGGARSVRVELTHTARSSHVEVRNDGATPTSRAPGGGYGLQGLRERVDLYGGTLTAGPHPERADVFLVSADLSGEQP
ncbi:sensor histidine kinase [Kocuria sp.]|uniref:sensor histidine kinase n=1 Tax=Kocuria sp. TaxID=1871328 RepID=UPI0026DC588F|nr:histidine kinase [Kocuria sp.]MDO4918968.1 histidine kinase [Kocuria sp.]